MRRLCPQVLWFALPGVLLGAGLISDCTGWQSAGVAPQRARDASRPAVTVLPARDHSLPKAPALSRGQGAMCNPVTAVPRPCSTTGDDPSSADLRGVPLHIVLLWVALLVLIAITETPRLPFGR